MGEKSSLNKKVVGIAVAVVAVVSIAVPVWFLVFQANPAQKWALILAGSNDFYGDKDLNVPNPGFEEGLGPWMPNETYPGTETEVDVTISHNGQNSLKINATNPNSDVEVFFFPPVPVTAGVEYLIRGWIKTSNVIGFATIGVWWLNGSGWPPQNFHVSKVYSTPGLNGTHNWTLVSLSAVAPPTATQATVLLRLKGSGVAWFDDISFHGVIQDISVDSDGFPAQALQAYWTLINNGYDDNHTILMLYHTGDNFIDIYGNGTNHLQNATVDVENNDVNKTRFSSEVSNLASLADGNDDVMIYIVTHSSRTGDIASIHFEADGSSMSETEFQTLIAPFNCNRMTLLVDSCFSGNFISSLNAPGEKRIALSASNNVSAWYWTSSSPSHYAGSWFFHPFWSRLIAGDSIEDAYVYASYTIPKILGTYGNMTVNEIQSPVLQDNAGDASTYKLF